MEPDTIAHIGRETHLNYSYEGIRCLAFLKIYLGLNITHARNDGERVFKLKNKRVHPDGYTEVPASKYTAMNGDEFVTRREINVDEGLKEKNQDNWEEIMKDESVEKKRVVFLFHGCIWHGHQDCDTG